MAATVTILQKNTVSETATDVTSGTLRLKQADDASVNATNPLVKPASGNQRSFEKWLRLHIGATGPTGQITNPKFFTDGTNNFGTGISLFIRTTNPGTFTTPTTPANDTGGTDCFTFTSGAGKAMDAINAGPFSTINTDFGDYAVIWMTIASTVSAPQNPTSSEVLSFSFDEV